MAITAPIYSDLNQEFLGDRPLVVDIDSILQSIENIITTPLRTRFFNPEFGSLLKSILFDPIDDITSFRIQTVLIDAIEQFDPRVRIVLNETQIVPFEDDNRYDINLVFEILGLDEKKFEFNGELRR